MFMHFSLCVYIYEIYISACIWDLCMVRTDIYGRNASDSLSNVTHVTSSLGVLFMFLVFWELIGWFGQVVCWFVFSPQHWKQVLELSSGVQMPIRVHLEVLFTSWKQEKKRKDLGDDSCQQELQSSFMKQSL